MSKKESQYIHGFTLVEILVVISIAGLLGSLIITSITAAKAGSRDSQRIADLKEIQFALEVYRDVNGDYPTYPAGTIIGGGGAIDVTLEPYLANSPVTDPLSGSGYNYYYDSSRNHGSDAGECNVGDDLGYDHVVIFAQTMEHPTKNANWLAVCGVVDGDGSPTANSYGIVLQ